MIENAKVEQDKYHKIIQPQNTWFCQSCGNKYADTEKVHAVNCDCGEHEKKHLCSECDDGGEHEHGGEA
jgi:hypothetical protein